MAAPPVEACKLGSPLVVAVEHVEHGSVVRDAVAAVRLAAGTVAVVLVRVTPVDAWDSRIVGSVVDTDTACVALTLGRPENHLAPVSPVAGWDYEGAVAGPDYRGYSNLT